MILDEVVRIKRKTHARSHSNNTLNKQVFLKIE